MPAKNPDLHGNVPEHSSVALLLIDVINDMEWPGGDELLPHARAAAEAIVRLKRRCRAAGVPALYVNDNFGKWQSDFSKIVSHCCDEDVRGRPVAELLRPDEGDNCVLFTASDAYVRDFNLVVPSDCVASMDQEENAHALKHMRRVLKADTTPSAEIDIESLKGQDNPEQR